MRLCRLTVDAFRNLDAQPIDLHPRTTVLVGDNGQGKTNILEAAYILAALRSFRTTRLAECIRFGHAQADIRATLQRRGGTGTVGVRITPMGRRVQVDEKSLRTARDYAGACSAVVFVPEDLVLARGSPEGRRRFLDRGVFASSPAHLGDLQDYERALRARNTLLRDGRLDTPEEEAQREVLASLGATVLMRRLGWLTALRPLFHERFAEIAQSPLVADLGYESSTASAGEPAPPAERQSLAAGLQEAWARAREHDRARGFTTVGPHCDDLAMRFGGHPLRVTGSQGQQRAFILALKLAEIALAEVTLGEPPILLLDDVGSELDEVRRGHLFASLRRAEGQVVLTTTDLAVLPEIGDRLVLRVQNGVASQA